MQQERLCWGWCVWIDRFNAWRESSLANRIVLRSQLIALGVLLVSTLIYFPITINYLHEVAELRLRLVGERIAQRLQSELGHIVSEADKLSRLSLVANALGDSTGNQAYLLPFLTEYTHGQREVTPPALVDGVGRVLVGKLDSAELAALKADEGLPNSASIHFNPVLDPQKLYLQFPVVFHATGRVEGVLLSSVDLQALLTRIIAEATGENRLSSNIHLRSTQHNVVLKHTVFKGAEMVSVTIPIKGSLPAIDALGLTVDASADPVFVYLPLFTVSLLLLGLIAVAIGIGAVIARRQATQDIQPLRDMGQRAMEIANAGAEKLKELDVSGSDEIGSMAKAFNEMVFSLRCVYAQQEELVAERTRELHMAREHLRSVLDGIDDVVYALYRDNLSIDYVSASSQRVLGLDAGELQKSSGLFFSLVLEEDRAWLLAALDDLKPGQISEIRYRIRHADGRVRLVLNRMNLILDSQGELNRVGGLIRDITEAVEAETMLHLRERALASSSCGVVITDMLQAGQPIIYVNDSFERITGYSEQEVLGKNCKLLQRGAQQPDAVRTMREAISEGQSCKVVLRNWRKDGTEFWNELQLSPLSDDNGVITHYIGIQNDISANIASTQALRESEQRLMLTVDALHEGIWDWSIADDVLVTSPSWARVLGLDPDRLERQRTISSFLERLPPAWQDKVQLAMEEHFAGRSEDCYIEHQCQLPNGKVIWAASHGRVVERALDGRPLRMVGSIVDITERIESTERIIRLMSQLDVILTLSPDGIIYFDEAGTISFVNRAFERMTGIKAGDATGLTRRELDALLRTQADARHPYPECFFVDSCGCGSTQSTGSCLLYMDKPRHSVLQISVHEPSDGNAIVIYLHDVTRETEVDRMKSEFLSTAAHELRTPMTSILGYVELLRMREFEREAALRVYDTIHRQARRLTELINELLDLARIEARRGNAFNMQTLAPDAVVQEAINAMKAMNGEAGAARLKIHLDAHLPQIQGDPDKLQQACLNIISNAYKYSPNGGAIEIYARPELRNNESGVVIRVRDSGIGMSPADLERVFERFFRADGSGNIPGTGLGMSLVKEIVDAHHGVITVDSELGAGTLVSIWLPVSTEVAAPPAHTPAEPAAAVTHMSEMTLWLDKPEPETLVSGKEVSHEH